MSTRTLTAPTRITPFRERAPEQARRTWGEKAGEVARDVVLAALVLASASSFGRVYLHWRWCFPILGTAAGVMAVCAVTRRLIPAPGAALIDLLSVILLTVWTVIPQATSYGVPWDHALQVSRRLLAGIGNQVANAYPPTRATPAFLLLTTVGVGLMALLTSWLAFRVERSGWAVAPPLLIFVAASILGTPAGRPLAVALEVTAAGVWLLLDRALGDRSPKRWLGTPRARRRAPMRAGARVVLTSALAAGVVGLFFHGADGHGAFGWKGSGSGRTRIIVTPIVSLSTRLIDHPDVDVFTVRSPVPSYWQLTTLNVYSGDTWQTGRASYRSFDERLPGGKVPAPAGTREITERFTIEGLQSPWLPAAFTPLAVVGAAGVQYNPNTTSLLSRSATADGLRYAVTSLQYLATLRPGELASAPALDRRTVPSGALSLPPTVPASVGRLARLIVRGKQTEYAKALALQDYFYGPEYTYSLHPPSDGSGVGAITTFLFQTHTGYCQQFAGSYAVMARLIGLPTRLAIGFTTGTPEGGGVYQVTDANIHTWPEVWFPKYGWVPFEPTKGAPGAGFAIPGTTQYTGRTDDVTRSFPAISSPSTTVPDSSTTSTPATTVPNQTAGGRFHSGHSGGPHGPAPASGGGVAGRVSSAPRVPLSGGSSVRYAVLVLGGAALLTVLMALANLAVRDRRRRVRRRVATDPAADPAQASMLWWEELAEPLARVGLWRRPEETLTEFADRAGAAFRMARGGTGLAAELRAVAGALDGSCWDPRPEPVDTDRLDQLSGQLREQAGHLLTRTQRVTWWLDPRLAWRQTWHARAGL